MAPKQTVRVPLERLPDVTVARLRLVAEAAEGRAWLVGGAVRDLLLGRAPSDIDVAIEGDALAVALRLPVDVGPPSRFLTSTIRWDDGSVWDLVTTRSETYAYSGALPDVTPGRLTDDLWRRDFSVNALAAALSAHDWGTLVDPTGGLADLEQRELRILHPRSFADDPTRVLRALRYEVLLGFRLEWHTLCYCHDALCHDFLRLVSADRFRAEVERALSLDDVFAQLHKLTWVPCWLKLTPRSAAVSRDQIDGVDALRRRWPSLGQAEQPQWWLVYLATLAGRDAAHIDQLVERLNLSLNGRRAFEGLATVAPFRAGRPSQIVERLQGLTLEAQLAIAARRPAATELVVNYLTTWRHIEATLRGDDLAALGCPRSPVMGDVLAALRRARLDGEVVDEAGELALASQLIARHTDGRR